MKVFKIVGQLFLILCWSVIIMIGVTLIQDHYFKEPEKNDRMNTNEDEWQQTVISIEILKEKYQDEIEEYLDQLEIETVDESTLQISFDLKEEKDPSLKIPMLKKISGLVDSAKGRNISFKVSLHVQDDSELGVSVYDCKIDSFAIPDFLIDPLNQMISSGLTEILDKDKRIHISHLSIIDNNIFLVGEVPEEVQKVWAED